MIANERLNHRLSWWNYPLLLVALAWLPCGPGPALAAEIQLADCPPGVQATIGHEAADGKLVEIERETYRGEAVFEAEITIDEHEYEVLVLADGKLLAKKLESAGADEKDDAEDQDDGEEDAEDDDRDDEDGDEDEAEEGETRVKLADLPKAVQKTLKRESRGGEIEEIERETEDGQVVYEAEVEYETKSGELVYEIEIREDGVLISKLLEEEDDEDEDDDEESEKDDD
jgi:hypothetical protein